MKKFRFRLQRVLDAKESEERQQQREFGVAQQALMEEERKLQQYLDQLDEEEQRRRDMLKGTVTAGDLVMQHQWSTALQDRIGQQKEEVAKAADVAEKARARLLEVQRDKKVLEKLKSKRLEEYKKADLSEQQNLLDDIGSRQSNGGLESSMGLH